MQTIVDFIQNHTFWQWIINTLSSAAFLTAVMYWFKDRITDVFTKSLELKHSKKIEKYKSEIKEYESEYLQVRDHIAFMRKARDSELQKKQFKAAEDLMVIRQALLDVYVVIEYLKILNIDEIAKQDADSRIKRVISDMINPLDLDGWLNKYKNIDKTFPRLYLGDQVMADFDIYESITMSAVLAMKLLSMPLEDMNKYYDNSSIIKAIINRLPNTKDIFDKYGERYVYYYGDFFYKNILISLRNELFGDENYNKDMKSASRIAIDSRITQVEIRTSLKQQGIPDNFIKDVLSNS